MAVSVNQTRQKAKRPIHTSDPAKVTRKSLEPFLGKGLGSQVAKMWLYIMVIYGYIWLYMVIYIYIYNILWLYMVIIWLFMVITMDPSIADSHGKVLAESNTTGNKSKVPGPKEFGRTFLEVCKTRSAASTFGKPL